MGKTLPRPKIVDEEVVFDGFVRLTRFTVEIPWNGRTVRQVREVHYHGHVAAILPVDAERRVGILIRQFRLTPYVDGRDPWLWEVPAGLLDGDTPEKCAVKEAREEAGVEIRDIVSLGDALTSPGIVRECVHIFWGTYEGPPSSRIGGLDHEGEMIEIHELPMARIGQMADSGEIIDSKSELAVLRLRARRPDLFEE